MSCNILGLVVGAVATTFVLLASDVQPFVFSRKTLSTEEKWTAQDLATLARTKHLVAAVSRLTSAAYDSGAPAVLQVER